MFVRPRLWPRQNIDRVLGRWESFMGCTDKMSRKKTGALLPKQYIVASRLLTIIPDPLSIPNDTASYLTFHAPLFLHGAIPCSAKKLGDNLATETKLLSTHHKSCLYLPFSKRCNNLELSQKNVPLLNATALVLPSISTRIVSVRRCRSNGLVFPSPHDGAHLPL